MKKLIFLFMNFHGPTIAWNIKLDDQGFLYEFILKIINHRKEKHFCQYLSSFKKFQGKT